MNADLLVVKERRELRFKLQTMYQHILAPDVIDKVLNASNWNLGKALQIIQVMIHKKNEEKQKRQHIPIQTQKFKNQSSRTGNQIHQIKETSRANTVQGEKKPTAAKKKSPSNAQAVKVVKARDVNSLDDFITIENDKISTHSSEVSKGAIPKAKAKTQPLFSNISSQEDKKAKKRAAKETFLVIKQFREPSDRIKAFINERIKVLVIMRGCAGTGKSSFIKKILSQYSGIKQEHHVFSADNYFVDPATGSYIFNPEELPQAHEWVKTIICQCMKEGRSPIVLDNTNTRIWEMKPYAILAVQYGYVVETLEPPILPWSMNPDLLARKNKHCVPRQVIIRMLERYDANISGEDLLSTLKLKYNPAQEPPQVASNNNSELSNKLLKMLIINREVKKPSISKPPESDKMNIKNVVTNFFSQNDLQSYTKESILKDAHISQNVIDLLDLDFSGMSTNSVGDVLDESNIQSEDNLLIDFDVTDSDSNYDSANENEGAETITTNAELNDNSESRGCSSSDNDVNEKSTNEYVLVNEDNTILYQSYHNNDDPSTLEEFQKMSQFKCNVESALPNEFDRYLTTWLKDAGVSKLDFNVFQKDEKNVEAGKTESFSERLCGWDSSESNKDKEKCPDLSEVDTPKDQRHNPLINQNRINIQVVWRDASTNTNYNDFSILDKVKSGAILPEVNILLGKPFVCSKSKGYCNTTPTVLMLNRGTMTQDIETNRIEKLGSGVHYLGQIFPTIPIESLTELFEKCGRDLDWTVGLLLDSGEQISEELTALDLVQELAEDDNSHISMNNLPNEASMPTELASFEVPNETSNCSKPREKIGKSISVGSTEELVKHMEKSFIINDDCYSEHVRKIRRVLKSDRGAECALKKSNDETAKVGNEVLESDVSENSEEEMPLTFNKSTIMSLLDKYGGLIPRNMIDSELVVDIPTSLARQLYSYVMDSVIEQIKSQEIIKPFSSDEDEMLAMQLQEEEVAFTNMVKKETPNLREIMDKELALNIHKSQMKEVHGNSSETAAGRLSKQLLIERFPSMDPKTLAVLLEDTGNSLHQTINLLMSAGHNLNQDAPSSQLKKVDEECLTRSEAIHQANAYKDVAEKLFVLRQDCLIKAREAYNSGRRDVASYYSEMARWHMKQIKEANSLAATKLMQVKGQASEQPSVNTLDLHFLQVEDAILILDLFIDAHVRNMACSSSSSSKCSLYIITGRGAHSTSRKPKILPAVQARLAKRNIQFMLENPGMLKAFLTKKTALSCNQ